MEGRLYITSVSSIFIFKLLLLVKRKKNNSNLLKLIFLKGPKWSVPLFGQLLFWKTASSMTTATNTMTDDQWIAYMVAREFANHYFSGITALERLCDDESRFVYMRRGTRRRPDYYIRGVAPIAQFMARTKFRKCTVVVRSISNTFKFREPNSYASFMVCDVTSSHYQQPREFLQATVFSYEPEENRQFTIISAVISFTDGYGFQRMRPKTRC